MDVNQIPVQKLGEDSKIQLEVCETETDLYWKMAIEFLEIIQENNKKGNRRWL